MTETRRQFLARFHPERKPHGSRLRYESGCRCLPCRASYSAYQAARERARRAGRANPLVSAESARSLLLALSARGVGLRSVHAACGVSITLLKSIRHGKANIRLSTSRRILAVGPDAARGACPVPSKRALQRISRLKSDGFTETELALRLGIRSGQLRIGPRITAERAARIARFYRMIYAGDTARAPRRKDRAHA